MLDFRAKPSKTARWYRGRAAPRDSANPLAPPTVGLPDGRCHKWHDSPDQTCCVVIWEVRYSRRSYNSELLPSRRTSRHGIQISKNVAAARPRASRKANRHGASRKRASRYAVATWCCSTPAGSNGSAGITSNFWAPLPALKSAVDPYSARSVSGLPSSLTLGGVQVSVTAVCPATAFTSIDPSALTDRVVYNGLTLTRVHANGNSVTEMSGALGQIVRVIDQMAYGTNYTYDAFGQPRSVTDALSNTSSIAYNAAGFRETSDDPDMGHWRRRSWLLQRMSACIGSRET